MIILFKTNEYTVLRMKRFIYNKIKYLKVTAKSID